jgi:hypothetical protein
VDSVAERQRHAQFLFLERHRRRLVSEARRVTSRSRRYEDLCLAAEIARSQHRCLAEATDSYRAGSRVEESMLATTDLRLLRLVDLRLLRLDGSLRSTRRRLSAAARRRAEANARARFEPIANQLRQQLGSSPAVGSGPWPTSKPEPDARATRCTAITRRGTRCRNPSTSDGLCDLHAALQARPAADARDRLKARISPPRVGRRKPGIGHREPPLSRPRRRRPIVGPPRLPGLPRVRPVVAWAITAPVAVAAAAALIWTGLSSRDRAAPVDSVVGNGETALRPTVRPVEHRAPSHRPPSGANDDRSSTTDGGRKETQTGDVSGVEPPSGTTGTTTELVAVEPAPATSPPADSPEPPAADPGQEPSGDEPVDRSPPSGGGAAQSGVREELVQTMLGTP